MSGCASRKFGFSLVELVIVVVIIGIIAAIAVPRISRGAVGAAEASLKGNLSTLRTAIELYAAEHGGEWPATDKSEATFIGQLTQSTDAAGTVGTTVGVHVYGPYVRSIPPVPVGPNIGATGVRFQDDGDVAESSTDIGWIYNCETGHIYANTDVPDERGVTYDTY